MSQKVQKTHSQNSNRVPSQTRPQNPPPLSFQDDPQAKYGAGTSGSDGGGPGGKKILDPELAKPKHEPPRPKHDAPSQKEYGFDEGEKFDDSKFAGPPEFCGLLMPPPRCSRHPRTRSRTRRTRRLTVRAFPNHHTPPLRLPIPRLTLLFYNLSASAGFAVGAADFVGRVWRGEGGASFGWRGERRR